MKIFFYNYKIYNFCLLELYFVNLFYEKIGLNPLIWILYEIVYLSQIKEQNKSTDWNGSKQMVVDVSILNFLLK